MPQVEPWTIPWVSPVSAWRRSPSVKCEGEKKNPPFNTSGNGLKGKKQFKEYLFKKIHKNSVKKLRACRTEPRLIQGGTDCTPDYCIQEQEDPSQLPVTELSTVSHPTPSYLLLRPGPEQVWSSGRGSLLPPNTH